MHRRTLLKTTVASALVALLATHAGAQDMDATSQASFDTVVAFMGGYGQRRYGRHRQAHGR